MDKRYEVSGLFSLEVEGEDTREAQAKVRRIFRDLGIECQIIDVEEARE
ncbi:MAG TPA: hypothetical protein GXX63_12255 [Tissierellia bacterium]|nr:hypothetical protein [Tissierellia bacterium]